MKLNGKPSILNYLFPLVMITLGSLHLAKHGADLAAFIPVVLGVFALYLAVFNRFLLQRIEGLLVKWWYPIGQFITVMLLAVTFFVIFTPIGLFLRLFKKDILNKKFKTGLLTYWIERPARQQNNYTQQF